MTNGWLQRHNAQTSRLNEMVAPAITANRNALGKIMDEIMAEKQSAKITARVKLLRERLKNRGDFGTYNACLEIANLYLALKESGKDSLKSLAQQLEAPLENIEAKLEEYKLENSIPKNYSAEDFAGEKFEAKKTHGSDMLGIEHLWAKHIAEIFEALKEA